MIEHLKNEKCIGLMLNDLYRGHLEDQSFFVRLRESFTDADNINFMCEYLPG